MKLGLMKIGPGLGARRLGTRRSVIRAIKLLTMSRENAIDIRMGDRSLGEFNWLFEKLRV